MSTKPEVSVLLRPCRSPYCECAVGACSHPGFYDARGTYRVWPDGTVQESTDTAHAWMSDDYTIIHASSEDHAVELFNSLCLSSHHAPT